MGIKRSRKQHAGFKRDIIELTILALPAMVWFILFDYLPMFGVAFAFKQFTPVPGQPLLKNLFVNSPWVGLNNFSFLLRSSDMPRIMFNTLFYNIINAKNSP